MKNEELKTEFIMTDSSHCTKCLRFAEVCPAAETQITDNQYKII